MASVVLVHLSDIHFRNQRGGDAWDPDVDLRLELERDLEDHIESEGAATGLVVTGDVAFAGKVDEYQTAVAWLARLCAIARCREIDVWVVPGNHDVDRDVVHTSPAIQEFHERLRECRSEEITPNLHRYLVTDVAGGEMLLDPLNAYRDFATRFDCSITPSVPYWEDALPIGNSGFTLRLRGLTTPLISDDQDSTDANRLVLGTMQAMLHRSRGSIWMTLGHHPPSWLRDGEDIEELLAGRARIQLWGHKHTQRAKLVNDDLVVFAGAVHPQRGQVAWEPRYNILRITVEREATSATIDLYQRVWRPDGKQFVTDDVGSRRYTIGVDPPVAVPAEEPTVVEQPSREAQATRDARRMLAYAFSSLPYQGRLAVARDLHLLDPATRPQSDQELFDLVLSRAVMGDGLRDLWKSVQRARGVPEDPNPFATPNPPQEPSDK